MSLHSDKNPNPQGKGVVPILADWQAFHHDRAAPKAPPQLLLDWFVSALVLSARFSFRPVPGQRYFLFLREQQWQLSLISPDEWGERIPGACLGECLLRRDMTWTITPDERLTEDPALQSAIAAALEGFMAELGGDADAAAQMPGYRRELPYYARLLATGLGASLRESLAVAGLGDVSARALRDAGAGALLRLRG